MKEELQSVNSSLEALVATEELRTASAQKRNKRLWQIGGAVIVSVAGSLVLALFKIIVPIVLAGFAAR